MDEKNIYHSDFIINIPSEGSIITSSFSEEEWRKVMDKMAKASKLVLDSRARISHVPQLVKLQKPEAYVPQNIAIGPYHQFNPKLYKMQRCKLRHAREIRQKLKLQEFERLFVQIKNSAQNIKDCYHDNLNIDDDTLLWMMVYDGLFLLQLIYYDEAKERVLFKDPLGRCFALDSILKDAVMLENQIPLSVLIDMIHDIVSRLANSEFCRNVSPVVLKPKEIKTPLETPAHLLELIYHLVCFGGHGHEVLRDSNGEQQNTESTCSDHQNNGPLNLTQKFVELQNYIKSHTIPVVLNIPVQVIGLVLKISETLGISISFTGEDDKPLIPTASELASVNVKFCTTVDGVNVMSFKTEDVTLVLPALNLKAKNLEVIIRNLIAFESLRDIEIPKFANYIELMAAMIRTTEDVRVLQKNNVLVGDEDIDRRTIVKLFSGVKSCIKSGGNKEIVICSKDINDYYESHWRKKVKILSKKYIWSSQKALAVLATILLLVLMTLQTYCSIYTCNGMFAPRSIGLSLAST